MTLCQLYWDIVDIGVQEDDLIHTCITKWFSPELVNSSITSHHYHFCVCEVRTFKISLSDFQVCNTVLVIIVTMLYIRSPEFIHLRSLKRWHVNRDLTDEKEPAMERTEKGKTILGKGRAFWQKSVLRKGKNWEKSILREGENWERSILGEGKNWEREEHSGRRAF